MMIVSGWMNLERREGHADLPTGMTWWKMVKRLQNELAVQEIKQNRQTLERKTNDVRKQTPMRARKMP